MTDSRCLHGVQECIKNYRLDRDSFERVTFIMQDILDAYAEQAAIEAPEKQRVYGDAITAISTISGIRNMVLASGLFSGDK